MIGASSLDADGSILDFDQREVLMTRAIVQNARKTILVADVSKFELSAPFKVCDAKDLDYVILNASPPPTFENSLLGQSTTLIIAREKNAWTK